MWGITGRSSRLSELRRETQALHSGLTKVTVRGSVDRATLSISGELDFSESEAVLEVIDEIEQSISVIDLAGLEFIDSSGASALNRAIESLEDCSEQRPALIGVSPSVKRTLTLVAHYDRELALV